MRIRALILVWMFAAPLIANGLLSDKPGEALPQSHTPRQAPAPVLWAVVVGITEYSDPYLSSSYSAQDAEDFARALSVVSEPLFKPTQRQRIDKLTTLPDCQRRPTRVNLVKALKDASQAAPTDVLVVYLAGHAILAGEGQDEYYFHSCEANCWTAADADLLKRQALSGTELADLIGKVPARKVVVILDTCHAERMLDRLCAQRGNGAAEQYILAGCAANAESFSSEFYGHGLLTYSLLRGMSGAASPEEIDLKKLFQFACQQVPDLARAIDQSQVPKMAVPSGPAFVIGRCTTASWPEFTPRRKITARRSHAGPGRCYDPEPPAGRPFRVSPDM